MTDLVNSKMLRQWAQQCAVQALKARNEPESRRLLKMETALLDLARTQDLLDDFPGGNVDTPSTLTH